MIGAVIGAFVGYLAAEGEGAVNGAMVGAGIAFVLGVGSGAAVPT